VGGPQSDIDSARKYVVTTEKVEDMLKINIDGREELNKIESIEFNIFKIQLCTVSNELVTITSFILAKENIFASKKLPVNVFLSFIEKIQRGYKDVTYHN
jgi:hypothetical protein